MIGVAPRLRRALDTAVQGEIPFRHWELTEILPPETGVALAALPFAVPEGGRIDGRRELINAQRSFFGVDVRAASAVCDEMAQAWQSPDIVGLIQARCGIELTGTYLRMEYCQDTDGFWLEPHTDIGAKLFTMLVYLSTDPDAADWGTDLLDREPPHALVGRSSGAYDTGLIFIPGTDTWHGFARRRIGGIRRTLIVNYVRPEWRARHELAFPDRPIG